jgi:hypothetical protein
MNRYALALAATLAPPAAALGQASFTLTQDYAQDFDSMGTSGTTPPTDWSMWVGPSGTTNATWATSITSAGVNAMVSAPTPLTATNSPAANNNNGYNAARNAGNTSDRVIATAPTTVSGAAIQLTLKNDTGADVTGLRVSFDTVRFTAAASANELPGYWVFVSVNSGAWTNVMTNPTSTAVPNTVGVTTLRSGFDLTTALADQASIRIRWVDDNALQSSPDQIIGLNNVVIGVPEPTAAALLLPAVALVARRRRVR